MQLGVFCRVRIAGVIDNELEEEIREMGDWVLNPRAEVTGILQSLFVSWGGGTFRRYTIGLT
jgi:hypothetical protein